MKLEFSIYRYNPDVDDAPHMQDYTLEAEEGRDMMLLDANVTEPLAGSQAGDRRPGKRKTAALPNASIACTAPPKAISACSWWK